MISDRTMEDAELPRALREAQPANDNPPAPPGWDALENRR